MTEWNIYASINLAIIGSNNGLSKLLQKPLLINCHRVNTFHHVFWKLESILSLPHVLNCVHDSLTLQRSYGVDFTSNCCFSGLGDYFAGRNQMGSIVLVMIGLSLVAMVILIILENLDNYIHYRQKIWNIFHFSEFLYFVGCVRYLFIRFTFLHTDITFGELIHSQ